MDGQVEGTGLGSDPTMTSVIARPNPGTQGTFFGDGSSYRTFADTDQIPVVRAEQAGHWEPRGRWLAVVVGILAFVVVLAGAALGLVQAGVIGNSKGSSHAATASAGGSPPAPRQRATVPHRADLLSQTAFGAGTATFKVAVPAYGLTITSGVGRAWVSVGQQGQRPLFAGILDPHSTQHFTMLGPTQVEIGAGGTSVTVTSNHRTQTLLPPSAPFTYTLTTS
jgi:hypothetical protein